MLPFFHFENVDICPSLVFGSLIQLAHMYCVSILGQTLCWVLRMDSKWDSFCPRGASFLWGESPEWTEGYSSSGTSCYGNTHPSTRKGHLSLGSGVSLNMVLAGAKTQVSGSSSPHLPGAVGASLACHFYFFSCEEQFPPRKRQNPYINGLYFSWMFINVILGALRRRLGPFLCSSYFNGWWYKEEGQEGQFLLFWTLTLHKVHK